MPALTLAQLPSTWLELTPGTGAVHEGQMRRPLTAGSDRGVVSNGRESKAAAPALPCPPIPIPAEGIEQNFICFLAYTAQWEKERERRIECLAGFTESTSRETSMNFLHFLRSSLSSYTLLALIFVIFLQVSQLADSISLSQHSLSQLCCPFWSTSLLCAAAVLLHSSPPS